MGSVEFSIRDLSLAWTHKPIMLGSTSMGCVKIENVRFLDFVEPESAHPGYRFTCRFVWDFAE